MGGQVTHFVFDGDRAIIEYNPNAANQSSAFIASTAIDELVKSDAHCHAFERFVQDLQETSDRNRLGQVRLRTGFF